MQTRTIGHVLLAVGFIVGAFATTQQHLAIDWRIYGTAMASALVGLVLTRMGAKAAATEDTKVAAEVTTVDRGLDSLVDKLAGMLAEKESLHVYDIPGRIDDTLRGDLDEVADARMSLAQRYGLQQYADLMTRFATAERFINRAWSSAADGYVNEAWRCVDIANQQMGRAQKLMKTYMNESGS